jgi:fluoroquinolone resistance protein
MTSLSEKREFENQAFKKQVCIGGDLKHKTFVHSTFDHCDFSQADFTSSKWVDCKLSYCNLSLVKLDGCRLQNVRFEHCKFIGVNFGKCEPMFLSLTLVHCLIDTSNFSDLDLKGTVFHHCTIRDTHFTNTKLIGSDFSGSDLKGSIFHNADLSKANFVEAINYSINPLTNKLTKAKFSKPEVLALLDHLDIVIE